MTRPPRFVPGEVDRTSRGYALGAEIAENMIDMRTPAELDDELQRHRRIIREADTDPARVPYPGQYDTWHGFAERLYRHITERTS